MSSDKFVARAVSQQLKELKNEKSTPYVEVLFRPDGDDGVPAVYKGWLSEKAAPYTFENMRKLGCTFPGGDYTDFTGFDLNKVQIVTEDNGYGPEVKFINELGRVRVRETPPLEASKKEELKRKLALLMGGGGPPKPTRPAPAAGIPSFGGPTGAEPWNRQPGDDDIPY